MTSSDEDKDNVDFLLEKLQQRPNHPPVDVCIKKNLDINLIML